MIVDRPAAATTAAQTLADIARWGRLIFIATVFGVTVLTLAAGYAGSEYLRLKWAVASAVDGFKAKMKAGPGRR
jgi:hypothetical protein